MSSFVDISLSNKYIDPPKSYSEDSLKVDIFFHENNETQSENAR